MSTFLRKHDFRGSTVMPEAPRPDDEEEKERYVSRQLWWALAGLLLFALTLLFGWGGAQAAGTHAAVNAPLFPPTADLAAALADARRAGRKGVAVLYEMEGCGECARAKASTFRDPALQRELRTHFVPVSLRADEPAALRDFDGGATTQASFANAQRVFALPTVVFYDLDGIAVARQPGSRWPPSEWLRLARYVRDGGYENAPFEPRAASIER
ncbi:thioredoxin fold domain-containing protein [Aromatoleum toluclasticum]|uniref:thioredoxin fold domain-containing protein n=1 Tax=Aromatoleum toluclasticum TaxID=92003 RepID=UPI0006853B1C|nr:thioredoxin fold domain-containing protein [Aromatoleum toluclasticum]